MCQVVTSGFENTKAKYEKCSESDLEYRVVRKGFSNRVKFEHRLEV